MIKFNKSVKGYSHIKANKPCQDHSTLYCDKTRLIMTCNDGHGGDVYIRSEKGSEFASKAIYKIFSKLDIKSMNESRFDKIRYNILIEWNKLVELDLSCNPITDEELIDLTEEEKELVIQNPYKAYGTTLSGALLIDNYLLLIHLGDGEIFLLKDENIINPFIEDEEEPVANITYSMCGDDAFKHMKLQVVDFNNYDGVLLSTDGLVNPYQSYPNFLESFIKPVLTDIKEKHNTKSLNEFVIDLANKLGTGDDVSIALIYKD